MRESLKKAQKKYEREKKKTYLIAFNKISDKELIEYFDKVENKSMYVRKKIKEDIEKEKKI